MKKQKAQKKEEKAESSPRYLYLVVPMTKSIFSAQNSALKIISEIDKKSHLEEVLLNKQDSDLFSMIEKYCRKESINIKHFVCRADLLNHCLMPENRYSVSAYVTREPREIIEELASEFASKGFNVEVRQRY